MRIEDYVEMIEAARVYDVCEETPTQHAPMLSRRLGNTVLLKREDLQPVFSFKLRGAYNRIAHLGRKERARGVICASAGNHAQGVAMSAQRLGLKAVIVMPRTTPEIKIRAVQARGAQVELFGDSYSDASAHAERLCRENGMTFIHPYDDPLVIAGQGTIAMELLRQSPEDLDAVFVPVGGGGLIAGVAAYIKAYSPHTRVIGVEPFDASAMHDSLQAERRIELAEVGIFADGVAVKKVGRITFEMTRELVDEILLVDTDEICAAIKDMYDEKRVIVEPAGALAIAGMKRFLIQTEWQGKTLACISSGANMNFDRLRHVAERAEIGERREALFAVRIPEEPGSFLRFCRLLGERSITEFNYRLSSREEAHVFVGVGIHDADEIQHLKKLFAHHGYYAVDLMDNELAKLHIRHMVGGACALARDERIYRFEFPERPSALLDFLEKLAGRWNISLFHYRNHGAAYGRVLTGFEVPEADMPAFHEYLDALRYPYRDENGNPALIFLQGADRKAEDDHES